MLLVNRAIDVSKNKQFLKLVLGFSESYKSCWFRAMGI